MEIQNILNSTLTILKITIIDFAVLNKTLNIEVLVSSKEFDIVSLRFNDVKRLNIDSNYYSCSDFQKIVLEDLSSAQMEGIMFKVYISEDLMTFYCHDMVVEQFV